MSRQRARCAWCSRARALGLNVRANRGHGTYQLDNKLIASVSGVVEQVNKLVTVKSLRSRYQADVGDVVVGRITEVSIDASAREPRDSALAQRTNQRARWARNAGESM